MQQRRLESTEATADFAASLLEGLSPRNDGQATVLALSGDLGAGKTAFVQALAHHMGVDEWVTSPTFVIMKTYKLRGAGDEMRAGNESATRNPPSASFSRLIHIDAYRMKDGGELAALGWRELCADPKNLIALEWPEMVADVVPASAIKLTFAHVDETTRDVTHHDGN